MVRAVTNKKSAMRPSSLLAMVVQVDVHQRKPWIAADKFAQDAVDERFRATPADWPAARQTNTLKLFNNSETDRLTVMHPVKGDRGETPQYALLCEDVFKRKQYYHFFFGRPALDDKDADARRQRSKALLARIHEASSHSIDDCELNLTMAPSLDFYISFNANSLTRQKLGPCFVQPTARAALSGDMKQLVSRMIDKTVPLEICAKEYEIWRQTTQALLTLTLQLQSEDKVSLQSASTTVFYMFYIMAKLEGAPWTNELTEHPTRGQLLELVCEMHNVIDNLKVTEKSRWRIARLLYYVADLEANYNISTVRLPSCIATLDELMMGGLTVDTLRSIMASLVAAELNVQKLYQKYLRNIWITDLVISSEGLVMVVPPFELNQGCQGPSRKWLGSPCDEGQDAWAAEAYVLSYIMLTILAVMEPHQRTEAEALVFDLMANKIPNLEALCRHDFFRGYDAWELPCPLFYNWGLARKRSGQGLPCSKPHERAEHASFPNL